MRRAAPIVSTDCLLRAVQAESRPQTTAEIAARVGYSGAALATRLSKLAAYGKIACEHHKGYARSGQHIRYCAWSAK